jgi:uncharacterized phage protein gp47/JayE
MPSKEVILQRLLDNVPDEYDKSEGSFFYDNFASVATELEIGYREQEKGFNQILIKNASGENLETRCEEKGIFRKKGTKATGLVTITGEEGATIKIGDKVASDILTYTVLDTATIKNEELIAKVECDQYGAIGNAPVAAIKFFPITLPGLNTVTNRKPFNNGYNEESDDALRERYYTKVRTPSTSGNKYHYKLWAKEVTGIGDAKVFPLAYGPGTVKVVVINAEKQPVSTELVKKVYQNMELVRPIGATVTVASAISKVINVTAKIVVSNDSTINIVKDLFNSEVKAHLKEVAFNQSYVSYAKIGTLLLNIKGVIDYQELKINNGVANVPLLEEQVPVLGTISLEVI